MKCVETDLPGVLLLEPPVYRDARGDFLETFNARGLRELGLPDQWCQDNFSRSRKNVLRGIHYQVVRPQGKLVWVAHGKVLDIAVDLRRSSPNFGRHMSIELSDENHRMLWIPARFGHGFLAQSDDVCFCYKTTDYHYKEGERSIRWDDPQLGIDWNAASDSLIISDKDRQASWLRDAEVFE